MGRWHEAVWVPHQRFSPRPMKLPVGLRNLPPGPQVEVAYGAEPEPGVLLDRGAQGGNPARAEGAMVGWGKGARAAVRLGCGSPVSANAVGTHEGQCARRGVSVGACADGDAGVRVGGAHLCMAAAGPPETGEVGRPR